MITRLRRYARTPSEAALDLMGVIRGPGMVRCIVLGHQKSGTTAVGALLARCADRGYANDPLYAVDGGRAQVVQRLLGESDALAAVVREHRALFGRTIVKDPDLTFVRPAIGTVFAAAAVVHVVRSPFATIRSIADRLALSADDLLLPAERLTLPNAHWRLILSGHLPRIDGGCVAEVLARRCSLALETARLDGDAVLRLRYEDFNRRKAETIAELASAVGLSPRIDIRDVVDRPFQLRGRPDVNLQERLGVRCLEIIHSECRSALEAFDYGKGDA